MVVISSTFSAPASGILYQTPGTKLIVNEQELGTATLYITENNVVWGGGQLTSGGPAPNLTLSYPHISLHAVQRNPSPALYMVIGYELRLPQLQQGGGDAQPEEDDDDDFDADNSPMTQLRFVPPNEGDLSGMYAAMNQGQQLHPDPEDAEDPYMDGEDIDEGEEEEFEDAEESNPTVEDAASRLRQMRLENANGVQHDNEADDAIGDE